MTEFVLKIEAIVTRAINGQKVQAFSHTFVTSQVLNMGFSVPSPETFYTDMPFETWVSNSIFISDIAYYFDSYLYFVDTTNNTGTPQTLK